MADKRIFRQAALDRLASPEQLDHLVPVADAQGWIALAVCAVLALGALAWGFMGSLPITLAARGTLTGDGHAVLRVPPGAIRPGMTAMLDPGDAVLRGTVERVISAGISSDMRGDLRGDRHQLVRVAVPASLHAAGTPVDAEIVLARRSPLALLVPALR